MDSDAEKGLRYRQRAEELLKIAWRRFQTLNRSKSLLNAGRDYLRLSVSFVEP